MPTIALRLAAASLVTVAVIGVSTAARADVPPDDSCEGQGAKSGDSCHHITRGGGTCKTRSCEGVKALPDGGMETVASECLYCDTDDGGCATAGSPPAAVPWLVVVGAALAASAFQRRRRG